MWTKSLGLGVFEVKGETPGALASADESDEDEDDDGKCYDTPGRRRTTGVGSRSRSQASATPLKHPSTSRPLIEELDSHH